MISTQVDANIVLDAGDLSPAYLLQDCGAVRIILPLRVAKELDGLKNSADEDVARRARRANACAEINPCIGFIFSAAMRLC